MKPTLVFDIETIPDVAGLRRLHGLPADMSDAEVAELAFQQGRISEIRDYCETDVVNTYLVLCRFRLMRGELSRTEYEAEVAFVRTELARLEKPHWAEYLAAWSA